jgi:hypothetical protein
MTLVIPPPPARTDHTLRLMGEAGYSRSGPEKFEVPLGVDLQDLVEAGLGMAERYQTRACDRKSGPPALAVAAPAWAMAAPALAVAAPAWAMAEPALLPVFVGLLVLHVGYRELHKRLR